MVANRHPCYWQNLCFFAVGLGVVLSACGGNIAGDKKSGVFGSENGDPGPAFTRRLNQREYVNTVQQLLGIDASTEASQLAQDVASGGFSNAAVLQQVTAFHVERYQAAAVSIADKLIADSTKLSQVVGCDLTSNTDACLKTFIKTFGRRVFRRPLTDDEAAAFFTLAKTETDAKMGVYLVVGAALQSPSFIFRFELGTPDDARTNLNLLNGYEMASRLSFLLRASTPSDGLLDAAGKGDLDTVAGVEKAARDLINEGTPKTAMRQFFDEWFRFSDLNNVSAHNEMYQLFDDHFWANGSSYLNLFTSDYGYVDNTLASIYNVSAPSGAQLGKVAFDQDPNRGGFFTTAAFFVASSHNGVNAKIYRGKYVRDVILCDPMPAPPPNVPLPMPMQGETPEDALVRHSADPACSGCHTRLDPVGNGLERYTATGAFRDKYDSGKTAIIAGNIAGIDASDFSGGSELGAVVRNTDLIKNCLVKTAFRWIFARNTGVEGVNDQPTLDQVRQAADTNSYNFVETLIAFIKSDAFRYRRDPNLDGAQP